MIEWIAIGVLVAIGLFLLNVEHHTKKYKIILIVILGAIIYFSIISVFSSGKADLSSPRGIINAGYLYIGWIGETSSKLWDIGVDTTHMVGNAIKINNTEDKPKKK